MKFFFLTRGAQNVSRRALMCFFLAASAARAAASPPGDVPQLEMPPTFPSPNRETNAPDASTRENVKREEAPPVLALPAPPEKTSAPPDFKNDVPRQAPSKTDAMLKAPPISEIPPAASTRSGAAELARQGETLPQAAKRLGLPLPLSRGEVRIYKARRRLEIWNGDKLLKSYAVSLGAQPRGRKQKQGDGRTPEGRFYICTRNARDSAFHIFLGLSYPALPDAARAANSRQITWREYSLIRSRLASRSAPLWRTRLGGWVGIHGGTDGSFATKRMMQRGSADWTAGCIALTNREIEEIYAATRIGTPVIVRP